MHLLASIVALSGPFIVHGPVRISDAAAQWIFYMVAEGLFAVGALVTYERWKRAREQTRPQAVLLHLTMKSRWRRGALVAKIAGTGVDSIAEAQRRGGLAVIRARVVDRVSSLGRDVGGAVASPWVGMTSEDAILIEDDLGQRMRIQITGALEGSFVIGAEVVAVGELQGASIPSKASTSGPFRDGAAPEPRLDLVAGAEGLLFVVTGDRRAAANMLMRLAVIDPLKVFRWVILLIVAAVFISGGMAIVT